MTESRTTLYAIEIDDPYHAVVLRDLVAKEATVQEKRAANTVVLGARMHAVQRAELLRKYERRLEGIRKQAAREVSEALGLTAASADDAQP